ncbi:hypothetical protein [Herbaspirillum sp.]|uniref:hypothetical protein n=1 Tax=Herbaspirillum sp. TaxID=1890675 RepID=UPI000C0A06A2|nr:hypothetical protein [Herbaspirillum sp.]MAF02083.1 hypothetical protein [Herbaspirillum sp.]|tara:strand:- start:2241 stop:2948 length:708 start_codon:yes stop_codon:yes gene_type:complete
MAKQSFSPAEIQQLKLQAKFNSRNKNVSRIVALDELANAHGFSTWALLIKHAGPEDGAPARKYFQFRRTVEEMRRSIRKIEPSRIERYPRTGQVGDAFIAEICQEFGDAANAFDFAISYMRCVLQVPRFSIHVASEAYAEMRRWLPYQLAEAGDGVQVPVNRRYKPVGLLTEDHEKYEEYEHLKVAFSKADLLTIAHRPTSSSYLFADASAPWRSRENATRYLARLEQVRGMLVR